MTQAAHDQYQTSPQNTTLYDPFIFVSSSLSWYPFSDTFPLTSFLTFCVSFHLLSPAFSGTYQSHLYEALIPTSLVRIENQSSSQLPTAAFLRDYSLLRLDWTKNSEKIIANGGMWYDDENQVLYWTHLNSYYTGGPDQWPVLVATRLSDDGKQVRFILLIVLLYCLLKLTDSYCSD